MIKLKNIIKEDSPAAAQAKKKGLKYSGFGRWKDKSGSVVAKTVDGKLVSVKGKSGIKSKPNKQKAGGPVTRGGKPAQIPSRPFSKVTAAAVDDLPTKISPLMTMPSNLQTMKGPQIRDVISHLAKTKSTPQLKKNIEIILKKQDAAYERKDLRELRNLHTLEQLHHGAIAKKKYNRHVYIGGYDMQNPRNRRNLSLDTELYAFNTMVPAVKSGEFTSQWMENGKPKRTAIDNYIEMLADIPKESLEKLVTTARDLQKSLRADKDKRQGADIFLGMAKSALSRRGLRTQYGSWDREFEKKKDTQRNGDAFSTNTTADKVAALRAQLAALPALRIGDVLQQNPTTSMSMARVRVKVRNEKRASLKAQIAKLKEKSN